MKPYFKVFLIKIKIMFLLTIRHNKVCESFGSLLGHFCILSSHKTATRIFL